MIARLPRFLKRDDFAAGILSGKLVLGHTLRNPELTGEAQLIDGRFRDHWLHPFTANGRVLFTESKAKLEFANLQSGDGLARIRGEADLANFKEISVQLLPNSPMLNLSRSTQDACVEGISFSSIGRTDSSRRDRKAAQSNANENLEMFPEISEIVLRGDISNRKWTLTVTERSRDSFSNSVSEIKTAYGFCRGPDLRGITLQFGWPNVPKSDLGHDAITKFRTGR
jgi:hypothetical protein